LVNVEETSIESDMIIASAFDVPDSVVTLGKAEHDVWEKNFKLRVTSKHTGRKFDINLTCKTQYNKQDK